MTGIKPKILAHQVDEILSILENIIEEEDSSLIDYPILIGSHAAKWHVPSFREPNDWDLVATASQSILFIHNIITIAYINYIKLIHYSGVGLKITGKCDDENNINFE